MRKSFFSKIPVMCLTGMFLALSGCSSENNSTTNVPVPSVSSIQPIGKSGQIVLQFTQLAGMGANGEVQPEFTLSINDKDDYASSTKLGTHKQVLDGTGMAFLEFTIKKDKLEGDVEGPNKKIFEYANLTDGTEYFVWLQACYAGYGCGTPSKMSVVPIPMPTPLTKENIEFINGDGTLTIKFKNKGAYDEYGLFYNDVKCSYADIYKYAPQLTTTSDHYVISDIPNDKEVTPICLRSQNVNTAGPNAQVVRYINGKVETLKMGTALVSEQDTTQSARTPQASTVKPADFKIELVSEGNKNVIIKWTGDFEGTDAVNNYEVIYSAEGVTEMKEKAFFDSNNVEHTILGLENGKTYNIKVVAVNNAGRVESNTIQATPKEMVIDFNNLDTVLGSADKTFIYAEDVPHSDFWRITEVYTQGGRPNTDRLTWGKETALGNLYADGFMWYAKNKLNRTDIDFAFIVGEVITNGIESYRTITPRFLMGITNINYINDTLVVVNVKGKHLINPDVDYKIDLENYPSLDGTSPITDIGQTVFGQAAAIYRSGHYGAGHTGAAAYKQKGWLSPSKEVRYTIEYLPYNIADFETRFKQNCPNVDVSTGIDSTTSKLYDSENDPKNCYSTEILLDPADKTYPPYATVDMNQTTGIDDKVKWGYKRGRIQENSLTINGQPIDPEKVYKVLTTKKIADSLYVGLLYADKIEETNVVFWKALAEYIAAQGKITPVLDGRVKLSGGVPGNTANDFQE